MLTKFFDILNSNIPVKALMGANPLRVYPYGTKLGLSPRKPYAVYGVFNAVPYNYLGDRTDMDLNGIQVDIYAETSEKVVQCFNAIRNAVESHAYVTSFSTAETDIEDGLFHIRMEIDFHDER